ncbi:hypothetical protein [Lactobacillus terrae]|uniref:hypothetical protein n=1 Tax=Lactobacillus terrae TaxID=2269374 RepID=UPI000C1B6B98|nr:hypothetical protein [Lactobacillus terrae]
MKKIIVTLLAILALGGAATGLTACSNSSSKNAEKTEETHSADKITKSEIEGHDYVGVSSDNKDQYITFFTGKDKKDVRYYRVNKDGSQKKITYFMKPKLVMDSKNKKKFKIDGMSVIAEPDFNDWTFTKVGKTTIKTVDGKKWKLYDGSHKDVKNYVKKNAK